MKKLTDCIKKETIETCIVDAIVIDSDSSILTNNINHSQLVYEYHTYKNFGNTTKTYRIDKGNGQPGMQTHIHVYSKSGQLFAMNIDGTTHDGSKIQLSKTDQKILTDLGFTVPKDGILEWWNNDSSMLLLD